MPAVRWKQRFQSIGLILLQIQLTIIDAQHMQDAISMSSDGWRPIVGTRRQPAYNSDFRITQYKNPNQKVEFDIVKSETPLTTSSTISPEDLPTKSKEALVETINSINTVPEHSFSQGKIPAHTKFASSGYHTLPPVPYNSHQLVRRPQFGHKKQPHYSQTPKRKPLRGQVGAHSTRNEVFSPATNQANFGFIKQGQSNVKTRETQGLGLLGLNHYSFNQPGAHIEFNRFPTPSPNDNVFQQYKSHPVTYLFENPAQFKNQNDDYTRNLVPPPPSRYPQDKEKRKATPKVKDNIAAVTEPIVKLQSIQQFGLKPPQLHENLVAQLQLPFEQSFLFQKQFQPKEHAADVQVTKEQLKVFHPNLNNFNQRTPEYVDYDFHSVTNPVQLPKLQTYEVTEGKWIDSPNPYSFAYHQSQQNAKQVSSPRPQLVPEPLVELNVQPFLPTPYTPLGDIRVNQSPAQSEASTVFSQVTLRMNKYKNDALTKNPLFFDVKEVSTHYPILGKPEFVQETQTETPAPVNENGENTTQRTTTDESTTSVKPKPKRRRPHPRRPIATTITTTTTEESAPLTTEKSKIADNDEIEASVQTERPQKRKRPRPNRYRTSGSDSESDERVYRYRTTTPTNEIEESDEKRARGRHRYRQRGNNDSNEVRYSPKHRKRVRPPASQIPTNHEAIDTDIPQISNEATDPPLETQRIYESRYSQRKAEVSEEEISTKNSRFAYEPIRHHGPTQYQEESVTSYETTAADAGPKPHFEIEEVTDRMRIRDDKRESVNSVSQEQTTVPNINSPENEIDYPSPFPAVEQNDEPDYIQTTLATTMPTTTTTTTEAQTAKPTRTRGRPIKYNSSNRPRFSVKEYRQRLNQHTSTTPSTTTDFTKTTSEGKRLRFPSRMRTRLTYSTTTQQTIYQPEEEEENTEPVRRKFKPKDPRHSVAVIESTNNSNIITEKNVKSINNRLRPFGRYRPTTEPTLTNKVSIKPNLFSRRRPSLIMRTKILEKIAKNATEETTVINEVEITESVTVPTNLAEDEKLPVEAATEFLPTKSDATTESGELSTAHENEDDYSQRVSDLTSSFKNEYETPGLFKSVSPNSRRIPNFFTISTDDPFLPIEAFFPNIKEKDQK